MTRDMLLALLFHTCNWLALLLHLRNCLRVPLRRFTLDCGRSRRRAGAIGAPLLFHPCLRACRSTALLFHPTPAVPVPFLTFSQRRA